LIFDGYIVLQERCQAQIPKRENEGEEGSSNLFFQSLGKELFVCGAVEKLGSVAVYHAETGSGSFTRRPSFLPPFRVS
jgi:hypothetical protein